MRCAPVNGGVEGRDAVRIGPYCAHMIESTKTIGSVTVEPGARIRHHPSGGSLEFDISSVCESAHPEGWHGEVWFRGTVLMKTGTVGDYWQAAKAAEQALSDRVIELFGA